MIRCVAKYNRGGMSVETENDVEIRRQLLVQRSRLLTQQVREAESRSEPIDVFVRDHISLLEEFLGVLEVKADREGWAHLDKVSGQIKVIGNMKILAKKIGLSVKEYDKRIYDLRCTIFAPDAVKQLFQDEG